MLKLPMIKVATKAAGFPNRLAAQDSNFYRLSPEFIGLVPGAVVRVLSGQYFGRPGLRAVLETGETGWGEGGWGGLALV